MTELRTVKKRQYTAISNVVFDKMRYKLSTHAQRLIYIIASNVTKDDELFPVMEIDIRTLIEHLGIDKDNNKYNIVFDVFDEIGSNPLKIKNASGTKWNILPWFSQASFDSDDNKMVKIQFSKHQKKILLDLKENFSKINLNYFVKLPNDNATYLYPLIKSHYDRNKSHKNIVIFEITIERLKEWTYADELKSYDSKKTLTANKDFLKGVIGIKREKSGKWIYTKNKYKTKSRGIVEKPAGALYEISKHTELKVTARPIKRGRKFHSVEFTVVAKSKIRTSKNIGNIEVKQDDKSVKDADFFITVLGIDFIKSQYDKIDKIDLTIKSSIRTYMGEFGVKKWRQKNSTIKRIAVIGEDWYLCR